MTRMILIIAGVLALVLSGCQHKPAQPYAKEVKTEAQKGGVVAVNNNPSEADKQKAQALMTVNCGTMPVKVTHEGAVGSEWQITYECEKPATPGKAKVKKSKKAKK